MRPMTLIQQLDPLVHQFFAEDPSGHDIYHARRVKTLALTLCRKEGGDPKIIEIAGLVHDVFDWKFDQTHNKAVYALLEAHLSPDELNHILHIAHNISFKGAQTEKSKLSLEGQIVQDADRLDAIGAIGIARTFAFGGHKHRPIYDPHKPPKQHQNFEEYKKSNTATINHFYEKLLLLKDRMNTKTAKIIAEKRHQYMLDFLDQFFEEWRTT